MVKVTYIIIYVSEDNKKIITSINIVTEHNESRAAKNEENLKFAISRK